MASERLNVYHYSRSDAMEHDELALWRDSHKANIACCVAIEKAISRDFDGMRLNESCAQSVLADYGYKRVNYVLANTLQQKAGDGRFSQANQSWAKQTYIPQDKAGSGYDHNDEFVVESHPAVLDIFTNQYRAAVDALGMFGRDHCEAEYGRLELEGKVLVLSPRILKEECWRPEDQLWYAHDGFGCTPGAIGRSIRCTCLGDGEMTRWNRTDFIVCSRMSISPIGRGRSWHSSPGRSSQMSLR
jgi:hypothetical protein